MRLDAEKISFDQPCLKLIDTIEKKTGIGKNLREKVARQATNTDNGAQTKTDVVTKRVVCSDFASIRHAHVYAPYGECTYMQ